MSFLLCIFFFSLLKFCMGENCTCKEKSVSQRKLCQLLFGGMWTNREYFWLRFLLGKNWMQNAVRNQLSGLSHPHWYEVMTVKFRASLVTGGPQSSTHWAFSGVGSTQSWCEEISMIPGAGLYRRQSKAKRRKHLTAAQLVHPQQLMHS